MQPTSNIEELNRDDNSWQPDLDEDYGDPMPAAARPLLVTTPPAPTRPDAEATQQVLVEDYQGHPTALEAVNPIHPTETRTISRPHVELQTARITWHDWLPKVVRVVIYLAVLAALTLISGWAWQFWAVIWVGSIIWIAGWHFRGYSEYGPFGATIALVEDTIKFILKGPDIGGQSRP